MAEEIDPSVIKKTQEILGSVIKKPALTEKSLKKPPFRFLHDIITNVLKSSGFFKGLYTAEELQSDNVKDKENKILFLQKAIDVLAIVTNQPANLKPSKVVAGHDPQKTNLFLQALGTAIKNKLDSKEAVEQVRNANLQSSPTKALKDRRASVDKRAKGSSEKSHSRSLTKTLEPVKKPSSKDTSKSKDGAKESKDKQKETKKERERSRDRSKVKSDDSKKTAKDKTSKRKDSMTSEIEQQPDVPTAAMNGSVENHEPEMFDDPEPSTSLMNGDSHEKMVKDSDMLEDIGGVEVNESVTEKPVRERSHHTSRSARPPSARSKRTKPGEDGVAAEASSGPMMATQSFAMTNGTPATDPSFENVLIPSFRPPTARPSSARPSSSRPAPPRIHIRHVVENEEPALRPTTAKPVENVILDQNIPSDDEETFLVMEEDQTENIEVQTTSSLPAETPEEDKGSLVKKLLATKKDLEGGSQQSPTKKVEIDRSQDASRHQSTLKELSALQGCVQALSRSAVPLGRMLDFLQEDMDSMRMELRMWREEHELNVQALHKEQSATESMLEPLRAHLDDLDQVVQNQLDANSALKATIARNDERIQKMLASVNPRS